MDGMDVDALRAMKTSPQQTSLGNASKDMNIGLPRLHNLV